MFCANCGIELLGKDKYCKACEAKNEKTVNSNISKETPIKQDKNKSKDIDYLNDSRKNYIPIHYNKTQNVYYAGNTVKFGTGANIWLCLCLVINGIMTIGNLCTISQMNEYELDYYIKNIFENIAGSQLIFTTIGTGIVFACFLTLIIRRTKLPFYFMAGLSIFVFAYNLTILPEDFVWMALTGLVGPIIMYLAIRDKWHYMPFN